MDRGSSELEQQNYYFINEAQGAIITPHGMVGLEQEFRGGDHVDVRPLEIKKDIVVDGFLGVCGVLALKSEEGTTKVLLHGYFPSSLRTLARTVGKVLEREAPARYSATLHVAESENDSDRKRVSQYQQISQELLETLKSETTLTTIEHTTKNVHIEV